jgi:hypothetical protein
MHAVMSACDPKPTYRHILHLTVVRAERKHPAFGGVFIIVRGGAGPEQIQAESVEPLVAQRSAACRLTVVRLAPEAQVGPRPAVAGLAAAPERTGAERPARQVAARVQTGDQRC